MVQIGARRSKTSDPFVIPRWTRCRLADIGRDATTTSFFSCSRTRLFALDHSSQSRPGCWQCRWRSQTPPHELQLDASRGLLAAAARCALSRIFCISPVMGLTDRKRLVQQLTQTRRVQTCPANVCIGSLSGSAGPSGLLRTSCLGSTLLC